MNNYIGPGQSITLDANGDLVSGQLELTNNLLTFVSKSVPAAQKFSGMAEGIFSVDKDSSSFLVGSPVYYDRINNKVTSSTTGTIYFGVAVMAASSDDSAAQVLYSAAVAASNMVPTAAPDSDVYLVKSKDDLAGELDPSILYRLTKLIDIEDQPLIWGPGGAQISGPNGGRDITGLFSSANDFNMLNSPENSYAGNLILDNCSFNVTGTGSKIFNASNEGNGGAIDISTVNFGFGFSSKATSWGQLTGFRQLFTTGVGLFLEDGMEFSDVWAGGITIKDTIALGFPANAVLLKAGAGLNMATIRTSINFRSVDSTSKFTDFSASNITADEGLQIDGATTTAADPLPNFDVTSPKARVRNSVGFETTYPGGEWTIATQVETVISSDNVATKVLGVTAYENLTHFVGENDNEFKSVSSQPKDMKAWAGLSVSGGNNRQVQLFFRHIKADNSFTDGKKFRRTLNGGLIGDRAEGYDVKAFFKSVEIDDKIVLMGENITDSSNFTVLEGGEVSLEIRPS